MSRDGSSERGALEQFPLLMAALKEELKAEVLHELGQGQWLDQEHSVLGRNRHVKACKRLIRKSSPHAYYDSSEGRWLIRAAALDREIVRANRVLAERLPETVPPPPRLEPLPSLVKTRAPSEEPAEPDDETGIYERALQRLRGAR
jgi:hypothetical protein